MIQNITKGSIHVIIVNIKQTLNEFFNVTLRQYMRIRCTPVINVIIKQLINTVFNVT